LEVVHALRNEGFLPVFGCQARARDEDRTNHVKHMLRFRRELEPVDGLFPEVVLINSHDGSTSYQLLGGLFRVVCSNGLVVGDIYQSVNDRHQANQVRDVIEGSFRVIEESRKALERSRTMSRIPLLADERLALARSAHTARFGGTALEEAIQPEHLLRTRRTSDLGHDLFTTANVIQENIIRGGLRSWSGEGLRQRRVKTRAVAGIDQTVELNRLIWNQAEAMAAARERAALDARVVSVQ
jgi:hypothetical protein